MSRVASANGKGTAKIATRLRSVAERVRGHPWFNPLAVVERRRERGGFPVSDAHRPHLEAAVDWLVRAQDATPDDGLARGYSVTWTPYFQGRGWQPSYPETTGYIIPTLMDAAAYLDRPELRERALRAARWEVDLQMPSGAVQGGVVGQAHSPAIFNSGQVLLGWVRAYRATGDEMFAEAAHRVSRYLTDTLDADGLWRKGNSRFARADATVYNARAAWGLAEAGVLLGRDDYREAAARNLRAVADLQHDNGWFPDCCLSDPSRPLLHTLAYTVRGLLEGGRVLGEDRFVRSASLAANALRDRVREDGWMAGRFQADWSAGAEWSCLTGQAQMANNWLRLGAITGDVSWHEAVPAVLQFVKSTQNRFTRNPGLRGGIRGSFPMDGGYGSYQVLSWATKFFADALMRHQRVLDGLPVSAGDDDATS